MYHGDLWEKKKKKKGPLFGDKLNNHGDSKKFRINIKTEYSKENYLSSIEEINRIDTNRYESSLKTPEPKKPSVIVVQRVRVSRPPVCNECKKASDTISEGLKSLHKKPLMEVKRFFEKAKEISSSSSCFDSKMHYQVASILSNHLIQAKILEWEGENHPDQLEKAFKTCEEARRKAKTIGKINMNVSGQIEDIFLGEEAEILFGRYLNWMNRWDSSYQINPQEAKQYLEIGLKALRGSIEKLGSFRSYKPEKTTRRFRAYENLSLAMKSLWHDKDKDGATRKIENAIRLFKASEKNDTAKLLKDQLNQMKSGSLSKPSLSAITYVV